MQLRDITIDPEFQSLLQPITAEERQQLLSGIVRDGFRDPVVVWRNHGVFCVGPDLDAAFDRCVAAEQAARVYSLARALGEHPEALPADVQAEMVETVRRLGLSRAL